MKIFRFAASLVLLLLSATVSAETPPKPSNEGKLEVGYVEFKPMAFSQEDKVTGFEVEMVEKLSKELGYSETKFKSFPSISDMMSALNEGTIGLGIGGVTRTGNRERTVDFTHHHGDFGLAIAVHSENKDIYTEKDLKGKEVCTRSDTTSIPYLEKYEAKIRAVEKLEECWGLLRSKEVAAIFFDSAPLWHHAHHQAEPTFEVIDKLFEIQYYALMLPNNSPLREKWNIAVADFLFTAPYEELWAKYLGEFE